MNDSDAVTVRGLCKAYGRRKVVDGVDLDVAAGQIVGLIGANGAGKTTTVECIQGLRRPDSGTIRVFGLDPATDGERVRTMIGSQLQSSALPDRLRVAEAVQLFSGRSGHDLLERFGLGGRHRSAFVSLSGGERQRLFLVLALVNQPRLVILDELTQGLDPKARRNVWTAIEELRSDGTTVLLVTHELEEAERLCDRTIVMQGGRVLVAGAPAELVDRYGRLAVITFRIPPDIPAALFPERLAKLPGVIEVRVDGDRASIRGTRAAIAHVGAALVGARWVPADLAVKVPTLEDALIQLLDQHGDSLGSATAAGADVQPSATPQLTGVFR